MSSTDSNPVNLIPDTKFKSPYVVFKSLKLLSYDELPLVTNTYISLFFKLFCSINVFIIVGAVYHHTGNPRIIVL